MLHLNQYGQIYQNKFALRNSANDLIQQISWCSNLLFTNVVNPSRNLLHKRVKSSALLIQN